MVGSEYTLEAFRDLVYPNLAFAKLVTTQLQSLPKYDQPLFVFEVTNNFLLNLYFSKLHCLFLWSNISITQHNMSQVSVYII